MATIIGGRKKLKLMAKFKRFNTKKLGSNFWPQHTNSKTDRCNEMGSLRAFFKSKLERST